MFCNTILFAGSVAHLGERLHGMEEVASSILVGSTKIANTILRNQGFFVASVRHLALSQLLRNINVI